MKDSVAVDLREANTVGIVDVLVKHGVIERTEGCEDGVVEHNRKVRLVSCAFTSSNSMKQTRKSAEKGVQILNQREQNVFVEDEQRGERDSAIVSMSVHQNQSR